MVGSLLQYTKSFKVLFIEDDYNSRVQTLKMLENLFKSVETASDGIIALEKFQNNQFDIIFSDINMPNLDGIGFIDEIRQQDKNIPIVMMSAYDDKPYLLKCIEAGVDGYLIKPIVLQKLMNVLQKIIVKINSSDIPQFIFLEGNFYWNSITQRLLKGEEINLTSHETMFLDFLISAKGAIRTSVDIDLYLFDDDQYNERRIRNLISRLRKKIGYDFLESIYGVGYRVKILS